MPLASSVFLSVVLLSAVASGQIGTPSRQTFHVQGTIKDPSGAVVPGVKVAFHGKQFDEVVTTENSGFYEADLPFGNYTMLAEVKGFRPYRRPLFRVKSRETINFDFTLAIGSSCDVIVVRSDGRPPTPADWEAATKEFCYREDSFPIPSADGSPFELLIRYGKPDALRIQHRYTGEKTSYDVPVTVAYNLFSLQADEVAYFASSSTLRATGNVTAEDESGLVERGKYMTFKIKNGRATRVR